MNARRAPSPVLYAVLLLPFGATSGFVSIVLGYVGVEHGLSVTAVGSLVAIGLLPHTWKFLWAPANDLLWKRKRWYLAGTLACALTVAGMGLVPLGRSTLLLFEAMVFINSIASTFVAMSAEAIVACTAPASERGRAAGWLQAGNLGGSGLGGGLGLTLWRHLPAPWMAAAILGGTMLLCCLALAPLPEPPHEEGRLGERVRAIARDLSSRVRGPNGAVLVALCLLPMGASAASGLFSAIARDWRASASLVGWVNGSLAGLVMATGCLVAGRISDAMNRKGAYALCGALLAAVALAMALTPRAPWSYALYGMAYAFAAGLCYGTFTAFVLEVIGTRAAATEYNLFASLSNIPIAYMTKIDSWAADRYGAATMMLVDAAAGAIGLALLLAVAALARARARRLGAQPPPEPPAGSAPVI